MQCYFEDECTQEMVNSLNTTIDHTLFIKRLIMKSCLYMCYKNVIVHGKWYVAYDAEQIPFLI